MIEEASCPTGTTSYVLAGEPCTHHGPKVSMSDKIAFKIESHFWI